MMNFYEYFNKSKELHGTYHDALYNFALSGRSTPIFYVDQIKHILKRAPFLAYYVAKYIYKQRWQDAEPIIMANECWWNHYKEWFHIK